MQVPWLRVLAEGAVIVVSILLALTADSWWNGVESRREAAEQLKSVLVEVEEARADLAFADRLHRRLGALTELLREHLEEAPAGQPLFVPDTLVSGLLLLYVADPPHAVLDAFTSGGHLEQLNSIELRRGLLAWSSVLADLRDDQVRARAFQDEELMPYLRSEFDITRAQDVAVDLAAGRLSASSPSVVQLRPSTKLRNLVAWQMGWFDLINRQTGEIIERLDKLMDLATEELDRD